MTIGILWAFMNVANYTCLVLLGSFFFSCKELLEVKQPSCQNPAHLLYKDVYASSL